MTRTKKTLCAVILSVTVAVIALTIALALPASAATSGTCGTGVEWTLDDSGVLTIGLAEGYESAAMNNYTSGNAPWSSLKSSIKSIVVEDGITNIGNYAFYNHTGATSATVGKDATSIGENSFAGCTKLTTVTLGDSVTLVGQKAFYNCKVLTAINLPKVETIDPRAFDSCSALATVTLGDSLTKIGSQVFYKCTSLTSISLPSVTEVSESAFASCSRLTTVTLGNVTSIGNSAFSGCTVLNTVNFGSDTATSNELVIPEGVTSIGSSAFYGCKAFTSAELPSTVTEISEKLFSSCTKLVTISLKGEITSIGNSAFNGCSALKFLNFGNNVGASGKIVLPASLTTLGTSAFQSTTFTSADLSATSLTALPASSFCACMDLKEVYLPAKMTSIGSAAFQQCYDLVTLQWGDGKTATEGVIEIPEGVTLGASSLRYCTSVKEFILPSTLTNISDHLFYNCYNIERITFKGNITVIGSYAFGNDSAVANKENLNYIDFNGTKSTNGDIVLPASLKTIGAYSFQNNGSVKSVVIPEGVTTIVENAFVGCANLTKATINNTSAIVGANAFKNCAATFIAEIPYPCTNEGAAAMREAIIASGVSKGAVKIDHTDADNDGCCDISACYDSKENGYIIVTGGTKDVDYTYSGGILTILKNGTYTVASSLGETAIEESIFISAGLDNVTLILNGLNIFTTDSQNAILVDSNIDLPSKVTITLAKDSVNTLKSGVGSALVGEECSVITINGEGSLIANGGNNTSTSTSSSGGAGIEMYTDSVLIIDSGTVTANGGSGYNGGPGIGVSRNKASARSVYIINGGTVTANGGATTQSDGKRNGPGFGGSYGMFYAYSGGAYVVNGGTLIATGGIREGADESTRGAGIGNYCRQIQLISGNVTAKGGSTLGDIYMYTGSSGSMYYSYWNTIDNLTLTNDKINLDTRVKSAVIDHEAKTITIPSVSAQSSSYLDHYLYFCFYGDLVVPDGYTLTGSNLTLCYNSSLTVSEGAFVDDSFSYLDSIIYSKGMKFAKWLCPYEGVRTDDDLFVYPHGTDSTGEQYAKIYSTFSIKSIYYDLSTLNDRADLRARTKTCTDLPITIDFTVISLDTSVEFVEGYDYEVIYKNNVLPGKASYTVTPLEGGRMIGDPVTVEFTITARALAINEPTTVYMQAGGNVLDALPKGASAIYAHIDKTPQEIQNGKFTWYVDAERTTLLTNEYGAALGAGEYTVYWTYSHKHTGFENDLTGETILKVTEKKPQQIEIDGVGVIGGVIPLFSKGGNTTHIVKFDLNSVITVNGEPITDFGALTWAVNGIAPVNGVSTYILGDDGSVSVDQNGHLTVVGMLADTVIVTLTAAETESYATGVGQITININPAGFRFHFEGSAGDTSGSGSSGSTGCQEITISGVTVDHKIYDGQPVSYNGTPAATLSDGTPVIPSGEYTFTYYKQTGADEGDALDHIPYEVGNYWLVITYSDASYKGEYKTEFIIAHKKIHVKPDGTLTNGTLVDGHTVESVTVDPDTSNLSKVVIEEASGNDVSDNYLVIFESADPVPAEIVAAAVTIGKDLTMKYYVSLSDTSIIGDGQFLAMQFTMNEKTVFVTDYTEVNGEYVFEFKGITPQSMSKTIDALLFVGSSPDGEHIVVDQILDSSIGYSVKANAISLLKTYKDKTDAESLALVQLITDMLYYGEASQNYKDYNLEDLANENVENIGTPSTALPITTDKKVTKSTSDTAYVSSLTVWFDSVNKIGVKLSTIENVKLKVNGEFVELTSTAYYTSGIYAVQFGDVFEFELYENDELVQTFNYSVNAYVYAMMGKTEADGTTPTEMAELAKALYRYGASAKIYDHIANGKGEHTFEYIDTDENAYVTACVCGHKAMVIDGTFGGKTEGTKDDVNATKDFLETNIDEGISTLIVTGDSMAMIDVGLYTVTVVSEAFFNTSNSMGLTVSNCIDLVLPDATVIAPYSYISTSALRSVIMPKVKDVKSQAFAGCNYIKTMTFGSVIEGLGENVFSNIGDNVGGCDLILHKDQATAAFKPNGNEFGAKIFNSITLK